METCSTEGCLGLIKARGLCSRHYQQRKYHGTLPPPVAAGCVVCGLPFPERHDYRRIYCSQACSDKARLVKLRESRERRVQSCDWCDGPMVGRRPQARFCSVRCANASHGADIKRATDSRRTPCVHCGQPRPPHSRRFCSKVCALAHRRPEKYGLTPEGMRALLAQHNVCAICRTIRWGRKGPVIDHDHATGRVRGVLCGNCNQGLGRFRDDPALLRAAVDYLTT